MTGFLDLSPELRTAVYTFYIQRQLYLPYTPTVIGDRLLLPALTYSCRTVFNEFEPMIWDTFEMALFRTKKLKAVVIDLGFSYLNSYLDNLSDRAPMFSGAGRVDTVLVFTERSLALDAREVQRRQLCMWRWIDRLSELKLWWDVDVEERWAMRFDPPGVEGMFGESLVAGAMGGCKYERRDSAEIRIKKVKALAKEERERVRGEGLRQDSVVQHLGGEAEVELVAVSRRGR